MIHRLFLRRAALAALIVGSIAAPAAAQTGRVGGTVKDDMGQAIKGATITAENQNASPSSFTATTDEKGRFSIIGLRSGQWTFTAQAPGFAPDGMRMNVQTIGQPNPPIEFKLKKSAAPPVSALGNVAAKDLQTELAAADQLYNAQQWDQAIAAYKTILAKAPALSVINLQIAAAYRNKKEYDAAIGAYNDLLKIDPNNDKAKIGIGMTNLEKGDLQAADDTLTRNHTALPPESSSTPHSSAMASTISRPRPAAMLPDSPTCHDSCRGSSASSDTPSTSTSRRNCPLLPAVMISSPSAHGSGS
jgi:hypothetical protein